jgi:hypothetical protein
MGLPPCFCWITGRNAIVVNHTGIRRVAGLLSVDAMGQRFAGSRLRQSRLDFGGGVLVVVFRIG